MVNKGSSFSNEPISILKGNEPFLFLTLAVVSKRMHLKCVLLGGGGWGVEKEEEKLPNTDAQCGLESHAMDCKRERNYLISFIPLSGRSLEYL